MEVSSETSDTQGRNAQMLYPVLPNVFYKALLPIFSVDICEFPFQQYTLKVFLSLENTFKNIESAVI